MIMYVGDEMMKDKKKYILTFIVAIVILVIFVIYGIMIYTGGKLTELNSNEVIEKINNKESFVLIVSQTTCSHCMVYKPKVKEIANKHDIEIFYIDVDLLDKKESKEFGKYIYTDGTPVTIFFIDGEEETTANRINGNTSSKRVEDSLKKYGFIK